METQKEKLTIIYSQEKTNWVKRFLIFIPLISLQVAEIPYIFTDYEGSGVYVSLFLFIYMASLYVFLRGYIRLRRSIAILPTSIAVLSIIFATLHVMIGDIKSGYELNYIILTFAQAFKLLFIFPLIISLINTCDLKDIDVLIRWYVWVYFFLVLVAFLGHDFLPAKPRLVTGYTGGFRFAGFHDELVYFSYSSLVVSLYIFRRRLRSFSFLLLLPILLWGLLYITKSNAIPIFGIVLSLTFFLIKIKKGYRYVFIFFLIFIFTFLGGVYLFEAIARNFAYYIALIFPRTSLKEVVEGVDISMLFHREQDVPPLLLRWSIMYAGLQYFINNFFSIPAGLGKAIYLEGFYNQFFEFKSIDSLGFTAFLSDFLWLAIPLLVFLSIPIIKLQRSLQFAKSTDLIYHFYILMLSITVLMLHAGYTNTAIWTMILLNYRALTKFKEALSLSIKMDQRE